MTTDTPTPTCSNGTSAIVQTTSWLELTRPRPDALVQLSSMRQPGRVWTNCIGVYRDIEQASQVAHERDQDGENVYYTWLASDAPRTIDNALTRTVHADLDRVVNKAAPEDTAQRGRLTQRNKDWLWLLERAATIPGLVLVRTGAYNLQAHVFIADGTMDMRDYQDLCRGLGEALANMPSGRVEPDPKVQPNDALRLVGTHNHKAGSEARVGVVYRSPIPVTTSRELARVCPPPRSGYRKARSGREMPGVPTEYGASLHWKAAPKEVRDSWRLLNAKHREGHGGRFNTFIWWLHVCTDAGVSPDHIWEMCHRPLSPLRDTYIDEEFPPHRHSHLWGLIVGTRNKEN